MIIHETIRRNQNAIADICRRFHVRRLEAFGSAERGYDFDLNSGDGDFLLESYITVQFPTIRTFFDFRQELLVLMGVKVDLSESSVSKNLFFA